MGAHPDTTRSDFLQQRVEPRSVLASDERVDPDARDDGHPGVRERLSEVGNELVAPERRSPEYLQKFIASEIGKWAALLKAANIKAE
jgi:hypothetical protein